MVLLRPGWEADYEGRPPVYPVGCAGVITNAERLADGRYNIVLQGLEKFRILDEDDSRAYRIAHVDSITRRPARTRRDAMRTARRRLEALLVPQPAGRGADPKLPPSMPDEDLVNALAQYLELEPVEKQALLERDGLLERCRSLIELLEMKVIVARHKWGGEGSTSGSSRLPGLYSTCMLLTSATGRPGAATSRPAAVVDSSTSPSRLTW